jgi:16S rRNA (cytidine1402-2'-O)-methyltransferase
MTGTLTLVATPIGNLGDVPPRATEALAGAAIVCCEDTRRTGRLLEHLGVPKATYLVVNEHTEHGAAVEVVEALLRGDGVALVTDAGTPGISDPGGRIVRAALDAGCTVTMVPGPSAAVMALVLSGLDSSRFVFEGFLPRSGEARDARIAEIAREGRTTVIYEAPHRLERTLADLSSACGPERRVAVARELTKLHEEVRRTSLAEAAAHARDVEPRGEYVVVVEGAPAAAPAGDDELRTALRSLLDAGSSVRDAAADVAARFDVPRNRTYDLALNVAADR